MMGGRTAEKLILGNVSSGADDDIRQATTLARAMVARWGMADEVGPVDLRQSEEHPFLGREIAQPRMFSQETAHEVDQAVRRLITEAEQKAAAIVSEYRPQIEHWSTSSKPTRLSTGRRSTPASGQPESVRNPRRNRGSRPPDARLSLGATHRFPAKLRLQDGAPGSSSRAG